MTSSETARACISLDNLVNCPRGRKMSELIRIGQADVLAVNAKGQLVSKGKPMNDNVSTTNVKGLTPPLLNREMDAIVNRATKAERSLTPLEINRIQELQQELVNKEWIAKEAKLAAARKLGAKMKSESDQKRLDAQSPRVKDVISRSNSGDRQDRSAAIKARHARLKGR